MWLDSLRRLLAGNSRSSGARHSRSPRRRIVPTLDYLEDRTLLSANFTITNLADGVTGSATNSNSTLRDAIIAANQDTGTDTINLQAGTYTLSLANTAGHENASATGDLNITNTKNTLIIKGAGTSGSNATYIDQTVADRVFQIANGATVQFENVIIEGGDAVDDGTAGAKAGSTAALGGGVLNNGGNVSLTNAGVESNRAVGGTSQNAQGGGIYSAGGSLTLKNVTVEFNYADGGNGTAASLNGGNAAGAGLYLSKSTTTISGTNQIEFNSASGGRGASGMVAGSGGSAQGGGIYADSVALTLPGGSVSFNYANGGRGGAGKTGTAAHATGGIGGTGGLAEGGGIFSTGGSVTLNNSEQVNVNYSKGGDGGSGGQGVAAGVVSKGAPGGVGGLGGNGNIAQGGGIFANQSTVSLSGGATVNSNSAAAGFGGNGGNGGTLAGGGPAGSGANAQGGGIYALGGSVSVDGTSTQIDFNTLKAGGGGFGGNGGGGGGNTAGGNGGVGAVGGSAFGGGVYAYGNTVTLTNGAAIDFNNLQAGNGSAGGVGGMGGSGGIGSTGGIGGNGAVGGMAAGGGVYLAGNGSALNVNAGVTNPQAISISYNSVSGGQGGGGNNGGNGGNGGLGGGGAGGRTGNGANGGIAEGGGIAVDGSGASAPLALNLAAATIQGNALTGGGGGNAGTGGKGGIGGGAGGNGGNGGNGNVAQGGGLFVNNASLTLTGATITKNSLSGGSGGGGGSGGKAQGAPSNATKSSAGGAGGNAGNGGLGAAGQGGGLYVSGSTVTLNSDTITSNTLYGGQGGYGGYGGIAGAGHFIVNPKGPITGSPGGNGGNGATGGAGQGGGLAASGSTVTLLNSTIGGNTLTGGEGGSAGNGGNAYGYADFVYFGGVGGNGGNGGNAGVGQGGGVYGAGGTLTVVNSTVATNTVNGGLGRVGGSGGEGGGGESNHTFSGRGGSGGLAGNGGNAAAIDGGGVFTSTSTVQLVNATVANNSLKGVAAGSGGTGGNAGPGGTGTKSSHYGHGGNGGNGGNGATGQGGGLYATAGSLSLLNATLAYNAITAGTAGAGGAGGQGIQSISGAPPNEIITQLSPNGKTGQGGTTTGTDQGGGLAVDASVTSAKLENTIIALNTAASDPDVVGTFTSSDRDFIGNGTGSNLVNGTNGNNVGQYSTAVLDTFFSQLGNNGGPTQTIVPTASSPTISTTSSAGNVSAASAIAAAEGVTVAADQRGLPRVINNEIDIGATQSGLLLTGNVSAPSVTAGQNITYTLTLDNNGPNTLSNVTVSDTVPPNTTFVSVTTPSGWTATTPAVGSTGTAVSFNIGSLAPNTTTTFTIVVQVASGTQGTSITDTATVSTPSTVVGPSSPSVTLTTQVPGSSTTPVAGATFIASPILPDPFAGHNAFIQAGLAFNFGSPVSGPVALVLTGLPSGVTLTNASGVDSNGNPYINIVSSGSSWGTGLRNFRFVVLKFNNPNHVHITYTAEVVQGI